MAKTRTVRVADKDAPLGYRTINESELDKDSAKNIVTDATLTKRLMDTEAKLSKTEDELKGAQLSNKELAGENEKLKTKLKEAEAKLSKTGPK
jgi:hypothetical protein